MIVSPLAGKPAPRSILVDVARLVTAYYTDAPDPAEARQRVIFGTSSHRGSSLERSFNAPHVLAISQAICEYRAGQGIDAPLFLGIDTHALSVPACASALEVLAAHGVHVILAEHDEYTLVLMVVLHNDGLTFRQASVGIANDQGAAQFFHPIAPKAGIARVDRRLARRYQGCGRMGRGDRRPAGARPPANRTAPPVPGGYGACVRDSGSRQGRPPPSYPGGPRTYADRTTGTMHGRRGSDRRCPTCLAPRHRCPERGGIACRRAKRLPRRAAVWSRS